MILNVDKVTKSFGTRVLFSNVSFRINERDRYALVGPNGAGKTTLMNIIAGLESADEGQVVFSRDAHPGYLEQESIEMEGRSVLEEVMTSVADVAEMGRRLEALEREMESADESRADGLLAEYGRLRTRFEARDGYNIESQARRVLFGLGFHEEDMERSTDEFSGGWQMRIALSKLLLRAPEILLLDEPTNHLDLESVRWLENFLKSYRGAVLVVSHDRAFMNGMVDHVAEIANGKLDIYTGNYDAYLVQRDEARARLLATGKHAHLLVDVISLEEEGAEQRSDLGLGPSRSRLVELRKDAIAQVELLELVLGEIRELDVRAVVDRTRIMGELAGDHLEQRRFARAGGADERYLVATPDVEVEVLVDPLLAK